MTKAEIINDFIHKSVVPILIAIILYNIFTSIWGEPNTGNLGYLFMFCGIPFGVKFMFLLPVVIGSGGTTLCLTIFNIVIGAMIGGFILVWKLLTALCYIPVTIIKLI